MLNKIPSSLVKAGLFSETFTEASAEPENVELLKFVILSGSVTEVTAEPSKAPLLILFTVSGIITSPVQVEASIRIPFTTTKGFSSCFAFSHGVPEKASLSILVTLSGIVTETRLEQPKNASLPILVTLSGIVTETRLEQSEKLLILVTGKPSISAGITISVTEVSFTP